RGVFSCRPFEKGDFLFEYRGEVITKKEQENRERIYHNALKVFMFDFQFNGQQLWTSKESMSGWLMWTNAVPLQSFQRLPKRCHVRLLMWTISSFAVIPKTSKREMPCQAADVDKCSSFAVIPRFVKNKVQVRLHHQKRNMCLIPQRIRTAHGTA
ncbi:hypothetical protein cypCar_00043736, partial [Cyprinus carpio]